jgi:hypothetical protein
MSDDKSNFLNVKIVKPIKEQINLFLKHLFKFLLRAKIGILGLNGSEIILIKNIAGTDKTIRVMLFFTRLYCWVFRARAAT